MLYFLWSTLHVRYVRSFMTPRNGGNDQLFMLYFIPCEWEISLRIRDMFRFLCGDLIAFSWSGRWKLPTYFDPSIQIDHERRNFVWFLLQVFFHDVWSVFVWCSPWCLVSSWTTNFLVDSHCMDLPLCAIGVCLVLSLMLTSIIDDEFFINFQGKILCMTCDQGLSHCSLRCPCQKLRMTGGPFW